MACWDGYVQKGMKKKNGRMVPNCVPSMKQGGFTKWFQEKWVDIGARKWNIMRSNAREIPNAYHLQKPQHVKSQRRVLSNENASPKHWP
jgi:hypothetical protein